MSEDTATITRIFVYGTLMRGESAHELMEGAVFVESAVTEPRFTLVNLGEFPALTDVGITSVHGEVYLVGRAVLARLDSYEGPEYERRTVALKRSHPAQAYIWSSGRVSGNSEIPSGNWRNR